jgi:hypothetical protein
MTEVRALVRAGWLRFADVLNQGAGWYWMTPSAERVWSVLGR